ncbi:hypothetical protein B7R21_05310 [Subtercola boreus]|uniref:Peptidase inhibitor n=1 Tax=Subtercola boreus TaxID=120213 RepID=A0A3E0VZG4_9MICO|nr:peptidase inhibitor family I36 protein [Subtercola boreus]RFA15432.1 hypothetical protein B7R21_05310 [Subtercola boreus]
MSNHQIGCSTKKRTAILAVSTLIGAAVLGAAAPASAANLCGSGYMCAWQGYNYDTGWTGLITSSPWDERLVAFNDTASSVFCNGNYMNIRAYEHADFGGRWVGVIRANGIPDLRSRSFDNILSSWRWV